MSSGEEQGGDHDARRRRITYSREFLLSVAGSEACRDNLPAGVDDSVQRSMANLFIDRSSHHHPQQDTSSSRGSLWRRKVVTAPDARLDGPRGDLPPHRAPESCQTGDESELKRCTKFFSTAGCCFGEGCHFLHYLPDSGQQAVPKMNNLGKMPNPGMATPPSFGASAAAKISVDASLTGAIIGRGGTSIKQISRVTGAKLVIRDHESDTSLKNIELEGTFDQIKHASTMVMELILARGSHSGIPGSKFRTKLCEQFVRGSCTYGDRCRFAHCDELRNSGALDVDATQNFWAHSGIPGSKFRTKLCEHFARGWCTHGDRCRFAHCEDELRNSGALDVDATQNFWAHDEFPSKKGGW